MAWNARLSIDYDRRGHRSRIRQLVHEGPLILQKSFYPDTSGLVHNYILHPPGGLVGGDQLQLDVRVRDEASVLLTTPAAGKIYRTPEQPSTFTLDVTVDAQADFMWLPQENIVYEGAMHRSLLRWTVHPKSKLTAWDIQGLGRPGAGRLYDGGRLVTEIMMRSPDELLFLERHVIEGGSPMLKSYWGLAGFSAFGTMILHWPNCSFRNEVFGNQSDETLDFGVTQRGNCLLARGRAACPATLRERFLRLLQELHEQHWGRPIPVPRIWAY